MRKWGRGDKSSQNTTLWELREPEFPCGIRGVPVQRGTKHLGLEESKLTTVYVETETRKRKKEQERKKKRSVKRRRKEMKKEP